MLPAPSPRHPPSRYLLILVSLTQPNGFFAIFSKYAERSPGVQERHTGFSVFLAASTACMLFFESNSAAVSFGRRAGMQGDPRKFGVFLFPFVFSCC